ncbi:hypothetical protein GCM10027059_41850 [Myceligenerans halotolerans]
MDISALTQPLFSHLAGLLATDGSHDGHPDRKGRLQIELSERDGELLERIAAAVPWRATMRTRTRTTNFSRGAYTTMTLRICAQEARRFFATAGIPTGPKSSTVAPPAHKFSAADYTRGLLDGDGSLGFTAKGYPFVSFTTASPALAAFMCATIEDVCGVVRTARRNTRDDVFNIMVTNVAAEKLATWAYYDGALGMRRKQAAARAIAEWTPPSSRYGVTKRAWTPEQDEVVRSNPPAVAAQLLNRSYQSISVRRWRLTNQGRSETRRAR